MVLLSFAGETAAYTNYIDQVTRLAGALAGSPYYIVDVASLEPDAQPVEEVEF